MWLICRSKPAARFKHPNLVQTERVYVKNEQIHLGMEFCQSSLQRLYQQRLGLDERRFVYQQTLRGLEYLEKRAFLHCDLKPQNILVKFQETSNRFEFDTLVKISDFGLGTFCNERITGSYYKPNAKWGWTDGYRPPEVVAEFGDLSLKADVFSLGVTFLELLKTYNMFLGDGVKPSAVVFMEIYKVPIQDYLDSLVKKREPVQYSMAFLNDVEDEGERHFLARMLEMDPRKRSYASELLRDSFLDNIPPQMNKTGQNVLAPLDIGPSHFQCNEVTSAQLHE